MTLAAEFPDNLQILFQPKRYKVLWGGRGAGRSWGVARALLLLGTKRAIRVLCCRELQKSISESVHAVLKDQIEALGLSSFYQVEKNKIYGANGTSFSFEGIKNNTTAIKSYEGIDYCWVEEGNKVSKASWGVLIPTVRKETPLDWRARGMAKPEFQAEIWITFNPDLETDYTFTRFTKDKNLVPVEHVGSSGQIWVSHESSSTVSVKMTYRDNPWFPEVLRADMEADKERDFDEYLNVWEGHTKLQLEGAVFKKQLQKIRADGRICSVPYEPEVPVNTYWDLGKRDYCAIWFGQYVGMQFRLLSFFEDTGLEVEDYVREVLSREYTYGTHYLPHDSKHSRLGMKHSIEKQIRTKLRNVLVVPKINSIADGTNMLRMFLAKCWFDELECADGIGHLSRYTFQIDVNGNYSDEPLHDKEGHTDCADALRTAAQSFHMPKKKGGLQDLGLPPSMAQKLSDKIKAGLGRGNAGTGWMR